VNVGDRVAEVLRAIDAPVLFGVPGGQTLPLYNATRAAGMAHVITRDERNAACAADAYARVSGRLGVCDATVGPGVTNLVSGLAEAYSSSVPVLAIVADIRSDHHHLRRRAVVSQAIAQGPLLDGVTKWVGRVDRAAALDDVLAQALRVATTGRPGPVALEIPEDVWLEEVSATRSFDPTDGAAPRFRSAPDPALVERAADLLRDASRPVVLAGGGVITADAGGVLTALAESHGIPVVTTINGKGAIDERSPVAVGVVGLFGSAAALRALDGADLVLVVGSKLDQFSTHRWRIPRPDQVTIHVDVDGEEIGRTGPVDVGVVADARLALEAIDAALGGADAGASPWFEVPVADVPPERSAAGALHPAAVCRAVSEALVPGDVVVCDASYASGWGAANVVAPTARRFVAPRGLAGIGWSGGAALGARLAAGAGERVVVLTGDGAWGYAAAEVETAARLGLAITYVVLNNSGYGWIIHGEERMGGDHRSTLGDVDFGAVARGYGGTGNRATTLAEVRDAVAAGLAGDGPHVVDVVTAGDVAPIVSLRSATAAPVTGGSAP
jgi:acetolactate synthase-1/2/3 large subunit